MIPEGNAQVWLKIAKLPNISPVREDPLPRKGSGALLSSLEISNMLQSRAEISLIFRFL